MKLNSLMQMMIDRGLGTLDFSEAAECCGMSRDEDGFCQHRPNHPIFLGSYWFMDCQDPECR